MPVSDIKTLRKQAVNLINKNINNIDGRSIAKFSQIALNAQSSKVLSLIKTLNGIHKPAVTKTPNPLDAGIVDNEPAVKLQKVKKQVTLKDVFKRKPKPTPHVDVDVRVKLMYEKINPSRKSAKPFIGYQDTNVTVSVPKNKAKDLEFIKYTILNNPELIGKPKDDDSLVSTRTKDIEFVSMPIIKQDFFNKKVNIKDIKMKHAEFVNLDIDGLKNYTFKPFQCVYGALKFKYGFNEDELLKVFQSYNDKYNVSKNVCDEFDEPLKLTDGVSTNMILHLAKLKDFSVYALDVNKKLFAKTISKNRNTKSLVYILHNEHFYLMDEEQTKSISESSKDKKHKTDLSSDLFRSFESKNTFHLPIQENISIDELKNYSNCNIIYSTHNLYDMLVELYIKQNHQVGTQNIKCDSQKHVTYFYYKPNDLHIYADINFDAESNTCWKDIKALCERVNIPFSNQSISSIVLECEKIFYELKRERIELTKEQKEELLQHCENKCNTCEKQFKKKGYQFDHIVPLASGGSNDVDNIQVLCIECHHEKTKSEQDNGDYIFVNKSESSFNNQVKAVYTSDDAKPFAFIENVHANIPSTHKQLLHIDICKTRRNILIHNKHKLTAHTVMDSIEPFNAKQDYAIRAGIYYVETKLYFPIRGNGWYSHNMVKHLLDTNKIYLSDIKYKLVSTLNLDADYFKEFFNYIVSKFGDKFGKLGPNALVGVFNKRATTRSKLHMTSSYKQAVAQFFECEDKFVSHDQDSNLYCIFENHNVEYDETRMPLYKYVVEQEAIEMDILKTKIEEAGGIVVRYNTDCISAYFKNDKKIKAVVDNAYWDEAKTTKKYKFEIKENFDAFNERMKQYSRKTEYKPDLSMNWFVTADDDDFDKLVKDILESNKSCFIQGRAGCGKSTLLKKLMSKLDESSYITLAPTNKACRVVNGQTIHKFLAGAFNNKKSLMRKLDGVSYMIVDEISMVKELFYKVFLAIKRLKKDIKFILCGDFKQLKPVNDRYDYDYENSPALFEICDGHKLELTKCRRADRVMFDLCNPDTINEIDTKQFDNKFTLRHLSFTNNKRIAINNTCMKNFIKSAIDQAKQNKKKQPTTYKLAKLDFDKNSQDVELLAGMPIIARINCKAYNIANNETFVIKSITDKNIVVTSDVSNENVTIPMGEFQKLFYLAFCITVHKSQGCTFNHPYSIHEWSLFDERLKYVALSRATKKEYINIV